MQDVSQSWKNTHKQTLLNESYIELSWNLADPDALAKAVSQDNGAVYISTTPQVVSEVVENIVPYCTLEQNLWLLDGGLKAIPVDNHGSSGYVGDTLSDEVCVFSDKTPTITIDFKEVFTNSIPGITITWSTAHGEFADSFVITAYNGDSIVAEKEVVGNRSVKSLVMVDIANYDRIVIQITKWCLPYHRARVEEIFVGANKVYSKPDFFTYSHSQSVDPVSTALPKNEIKFSISNVDGEYDPYGEDGWSKYLMSRQEVKVRYGLKLNDGSIEWIQGGTFYLSEWETTVGGLTADFTARDLLEFMSATVIDNHDLSSRSLYELAEKVLKAADLPLNSNGTVKWDIDTSLKTMYTTAPLPKDTIANCLQLIANTAHSVLYQDRDGVLHIKPMVDSYSGYSDYEIDSSNSYSPPKITITKPIKRTEVKAYDYTLDENGEVHSTTTDVVTERNTVGETLTIDNPLIDDIDKAEQLGSWMSGYLSRRMSLDFTWRADVRLDPLDFVRSLYDRTNEVRMTETQFTYNGAFRGTGKGRVM